MNWSQRVIKQAGYKCRVCGSKENLTAHHLFSRKAHPEMADKIINGVCNCDPCHKAFHQAYPSPTTPDMYVEWAKTRNITEKRLKTIINLCNDRALKKYASKLNSQSAKVTPVDKVASVFDLFGQIPQINLLPSTYQRLNTESKSRNMSPSELAIHVLEHWLECASAKA